MGPKPRVPLGSPGCYTQDKPYTFTPTQAHRHGSYYCGEPQSGYATKHVPQCPNKGGGRRLAAVAQQRGVSLQGAPGGTSASVPVHSQPLAVSYIYGLPGRGNPAGAILQGCIWLHLGNPDALTNCPASSPSWTRC